MAVPAGVSNARASSPAATAASAESLEESGGPTAPSALDCETIGGTASVTIVTATSGIVGSQVNLSVDGFDTAGTVFVYMAIASGGELAGPIGELDAGTSEPAIVGGVVFSHYDSPSEGNYAPGTIYFWVVDVESDCAASPAFQLTAVPPASLYCSESRFTDANVTVAPTSGLAGATVTISISEFAPYGTVSIVWAASDGADAIAVTSLGSPGSTMGAYVPSDPEEFPPGEYVFWGVDSYDQCAGASFELTAPAVTPVVSVSPLTVPVGGTFTVTGTGFSIAPNTAFVYLGDEILTPTGGTDCASDVQVIEQDGYGDFSCTFTVPGTAEAGSNDVSAEDTSTGVYSNAVAIDVPELEFGSTPTSGALGTALTVTGGGWVAGDSIEVGVGPQGSPLATLGVFCDGTDSGFATVDSAGEFSCSFDFGDVPSGPSAPSGTPGGPGPYSAFASDISVFATPALIATSGNTFAFVGTSSVPNILLTPESGVVGSTFTVIGWGFTAGPDGTAVVSFGGSSLAPTGGSACDFTADTITPNATGGFSCAFEVPSSAASSVDDGLVVGDTVTAEDESTGLSASQTFTASFLDVIPEFGTISGPLVQTPPGALISASGGVSQSWEALASDGFVQFGLALADGNSPPTSLVSTLCLGGCGEYIELGGQVQITFQVPSVPAGEYELYGVDPITGNLVISTEFEITAPQLSVTLPLYNQAPVNTPLPYSVSGLTPGETYALELDPSAGQITGGSIPTLYFVPGGGGLSSGDFTIVGTESTQTYAIDIYQQNAQYGWNFICASVNYFNDIASSAPVTLVFNVTFASPSVPYGPPDSVITIAGGGAPSDADLQFQLLPNSISIDPVYATPLTCLNTVSISLFGDFSCTFQVPPVYGAQEYYALVTNLDDGVSAPSLGFFTLGTPPEFSASPASGPAGTQVTLTNPDGGFAAFDVPYAIYLDLEPGTIGSGSVFAGSFDSSDAGTIPLQPFVVPAGVVAGTPYYIDAFQVSGGVNYFIASASNQFTTTTPSVSSISAVSGAPGTVTFDASGLAPGTGYQVYLDPAEGVAGTAGYDPIGSCSTPADSSDAECSAVIPSGLSSGTYYVDLFEAPVTYFSNSLGTDATTLPSFVENVYSFTLVTTIVVSPSQGPEGGSYGVRGEGFTPSGGVEVKFAGTAQTATACSDGTYSGTTVTVDPSGDFMCYFTVPDRGAGQYSIVGVNLGPSFTTFKQQFTLTKPAITVAPAQGPLYASFTVTGTGFTPNSFLGSITLGGVLLPQCSPPFGSGEEIVETNAQGAFSCLTDVQSGTSGSALVATDEGGATAKTTFHVTKLKLTLSVKQGPVGATVTATGTGFSVDEMAQLDFDGVVSPTCLAGSYSTDPSGGFSCTFTVPSGTLGTTVTATDLATAAPPTYPASATATFTVTSPSITVSPKKGAVGATVKVSGKGFSVDSEISLLLEGVEITSCSTGSLSTSGSGAYSCSFAIPDVPTGTVEIEAVDPGGQVAMATFTVQPTSV